MDFPSVNAYSLTALAILLFIGFRHYTRINLDFIPVVGPSGLLTSYIGAIRFITNAKEIIQEGYDRYHPAMFKVPLLDRWLVVVSGPQLVNDLRQAREEDISFVRATRENLHTRYTLGTQVDGHHYHIGVVRTTLTRNIGARFSDIYDEIAQSFADSLPFKGDEWLAVSGKDIVMQAVCRTSNRLFVGLPLCRDLDYIALNIEFTIAVFIAAQTINIFPKFLQPMIGPLISPVPRAWKRAKKHLAPMVEERLRQEALYGKDWAERPNDLISWLLDESPEDRKTVHDLTMRIIVVNMAAIHTSSNGFTHALYHLAANPEYAQPLREEVETIVREDGWSKASVGKMRKIDSFLKESQRFNGLGALTMNRVVTKPGGFTFSDGTTLPEGTYLSVAIYATHHDEENYGPNPDVFDGFRFANMRETGESGSGIKHQLVTTNVDYLPFGHGRHACPGRFFAANELKTMLAHVVTTYDVKFEEEGVRPPNQWLGPSCGANRSAKVMFRKRQQ